MSVATDTKKVIVTHKGIARTVFCRLKNRTAKSTTVYDNDDSNMSVTTKTIIKQQEKHHGQQRLSFLWWVMY